MIITTLTGAFHARINVISAEVFTQDFYTSRVTRGKHGLLLEAKLGFNHGPPVTIKTDDSWRAKADPAWSGGEFDAGRELVGWRQAGFDDSGWANCSSIESVWTPLAASELPPMMEARYPLKSASADGHALAVASGKLTPVEITAPSAVVLTYDRVLAAYPTFKIDGANGAVLRIAPGERVGQQSRAFTLKLRDGVQEFEYPIIDSFSVLRLEFSNVTKPIRILDVRRELQFFPRFSMPAVLSAATAQTHNDLAGRHRDGWTHDLPRRRTISISPNHQEPICDPGDYLIESHANYYAFGSPWLARQDLRKFGLMLKDRYYTPTAQSFF